MKPGLILTFERYLAGGGVDVELTVEQTDRFWAEYDEYVYVLVKAMREDPDLPGPVGALIDVLAQSIIEDHLGEEWYETNVVQSASSDNAREYLDLGEYPPLQVLAVHRVHELARRIYQLQSFPWFPALLRKVRNDKLSGAGFELDVAWVLQILAASNVEARKEGDGGRGTNFDLAMRHRGITIPVEAKAKGGLHAVLGRLSLRHPEEGREPTSEGRMRHRLRAHTVRLDRTRDGRAIHRCPR